MIECNLVRHGAHSPTIRAVVVPDASFFLSTVLLRISDCMRCFVCPASAGCFTKHAQEVEQLRQKLQEVELGTALSQADSNFLQRELEEKEADIGENARRHVFGGRAAQLLA